MIFLSSPQSLNSSKIAHNILEVQRQQQLGSQSDLHQHQKLLIHHMNRQFLNSHDLALLLLLAFQALQFLRQTSFIINWALPLIPSISTSSVSTFNSSKLSTTSSSFISIFSNLAISSLRVIFCGVGKVLDSSKFSLLFSKYLELSSGRNLI